MLDQASDYANDAYYCNVEGEYAMALQYIDSAMMCLNEHYGKYAEKPHCYMTLTGNDMPAELDWWNKMFNSDFHVILDLRNEAAVAFLALKQWDNYSYNNGAYTPCTSCWAKISLWNISVANWNAPPTIKW